MLTFCGVVLHVKSSGHGLSGLEQVCVQMPVLAGAWMPQTPDWHCAPSVQGAQRSAMGAARAARAVPSAAASAKATQRDAVPRPMPEARPISSGVCAPRRTAQLCLHAAARGGPSGAGPAGDSASDGAPCLAARLAQLLAAPAMSTTIVTEIRFEAAHRLPHTPPAHKCHRLHGHSFRCEVHARGAVQPHSGWVRDFADLRALCEPLRQQLDHHYLNEVPGLANPTSELLAAWVWERLAPQLPELCAVVVHETCTSRCIYSGPDAPTAP